MLLSRRGFLGWLAGFLATALRPARALSSSAGAIEVICRQAWGAERPSGEFERHRIRRITVHHSAVVLRDNRKAPERLRGHQAAHQGRGWPDIAYHLLIDRNGNVYEGRPRWAVGDTATEYDPRGHLQVMCEGHFGEQSPSAAQVGALVGVLSAQAAHYGMGIRSIRGHSDYADTACPGSSLYGRLPGIRRRVRERLAGGGVQLVELCGREGRQRVEDIEAGTD
jgi:hypothetical protein